MKKFLVLFVVVCMVFSIVTPVSAANGSVKRVVVYAPETVLAGRTFPASVTVTGNGRTNLMFVFPRNVVSSVVYHGNNMLSYQTKDNNIFILSAVLRPRKSYSFTFVITTRGDLKEGSVTWLKVMERKTILVSETINVMKPVVDQVLRWNIAIPTVAVGNKPYSVFVTVNNPNTVQVGFDVSVKLLFAGGCDKSALPKFSGGEMYWSRGDYTGYEMFWRGNVPAGGSYTLRIDTASGQNTGTFDLVYLKDLNNPMVTPTNWVVTVVP